MTAPAAQRGLALVSVLWGVAILSLIAAALLSASLSGAQIDRNAWNAARGGGVAEASVNHAILSLLDNRPERQPRVDGTAAAFTFGGVAMRVWIQDESGRINLNYADKTSLQALFLSVGQQGDAAASLADAIIAHRAPDGSKPVPFRNIDELLDIPPMSPALLAKIAPALTVYGQNTVPNKDVAPREVLRVMPGMDDQSVAEFLKTRDKAHADAPSATAPAAPLANTRFFTVTAEAVINHSRVVREAVVQFTGDARKPYWLLAWR